MPQTSDTMPWTASVESWKYKPQWTAFSGTINHNNWLLLYLIGIDHNSKSNRHKIFSSGKNLHSGSLTCEARVTEKKLFYEQRHKKIWILLILFFIFENFMLVYNHIWSYLLPIPSTLSTNICIFVFTCFWLVVSSVRDAYVYMGVRNPLEHENPTICHYLHEEMILHPIATIHCH